MSEKEEMGVVSEEFGKCDAITKFNIILVMPIFHF